MAKKVQAMVKLQIAAGKATPDNDGFLMLHEIYRLPLGECELAALSACVTNVGPQQPLEAGVTLVSPENTWIEFGVSIGQDTVVEPFCWIGAGAKVAAAKHVAAGTVVEPGAEV